MVSTTSPKSLHSLTSRTSATSQSSVAPQFYRLRCVLCHRAHSEEESTTVCVACGNQLEILLDYDYIGARLNVHALRTAPISGAKYISFYPLLDLQKLVSLSEGGTPLLRCRHLGKTLGLKHLYVKNEGANPTGVFKDRGSLIEITKARELGAKAICCASTGNMAASVSAYAAVAKLPCYVVVPEGTPLGKLAQTISYGARIIQLRGTYDDCVRLCASMAKKHGFYLAGDYAFRLEGQKSLAYEVVEQLLWRVPDVVIVPVGCGTNISAIWKGFVEFHTLGFIDRLPKMVAVQPANVPTIAEAFRRGKKRAIPIAKPSSVATAVGIGTPQDDIKALRCLRESKGFCGVATEQEILGAEQQLAREEAIFCEPSSAIAIAVLPHLRDQGLIHADDTIVCVATGTGLKDPKTAISLLPDPPVLEPTESEIDRYFRMKLYAIKAGPASDQVLFSSVPSMQELTKAIRGRFNVRLPAPLLREIRDMTANFLQKGRKISQADLQNMIETSLNTFSEKKKILEIDDFSVTDSKHDKAKASIVTKFHGKTQRATGSGDGAFDAIMDALSRVTDADGIAVRLLDYAVGIDTPGSAAVVKVTMTLLDATKKNQVVCTATSPDVIVASVQAYEKGYNVLYWKSRHGMEQNADLRKGK